MIQTQNNVSYYQLYYRLIWMRGAVHVLHIFGTVQYLHIPLHLCFPHNHKCGTQSFHDPLHKKYASDYAKMKFITACQPHSQCTTVSILLSHVSAACLTRIKTCPHHRRPSYMHMIDNLTPIALHAVARLFYTASFHLRQSFPVQQIQILLLVYKQAQFNNHDEVI